MNLHKRYWNHNGN